MPGDETLTPRVRRMSRIIPSPRKIEIDFTDAQLTGQVGWTLLARAEEEGSARTEMLRQRASRHP